MFISGHNIAFPEIASVNKYLIGLKKKKIGHNIGTALLHQWHWMVNICIWWFKEFHSCKNNSAIEFKMQMHKNACTKF